MTENNALVIYTQFDQMQRAAIALQKSGYFSDVKSEAQAIVKVMAGAELGIPPFASMTGIHIIQGKPVLGANVIATLVQEHPRYNYRITTPLDKQNEEMTLEWFDNGKAVGKSRFSMDEAKSAGLTGKDNWKKYPSDMLFARAISRGARRFAPGIFGGAPVYTPDEMGADVDEDGNVVVDAEAVEVVQEPTNGKQTEQNLKELGFDTQDIFGAVVEAKLSENVHAARNTLANHCRTGYDTPEKAIAWMRKYRAAKDEGKNTVEAAEVANS